MKTKLLTITLLVLFGATLAVLANSHPDSKNNGKDSPRFYGGKAHPQHP